VFDITFGLAHSSDVVQRSIVYTALPLEAKVTSTGLSAVITDARIATTIKYGKIVGVLDTPVVQGRVRPQVLRARVYNEQSTTV